MYFPDRHSTQLLSKNGTPRGFLPTYLRSGTTEQGLKLLLRDSQMVAAV